jgi:hypothetical protein
MTEDELDLSWINDEEKNINIDTILYPEHIKYINSFLFYIDLDNNIERIVKTVNINCSNIQNGILNNDFLNIFINNNSVFNDISYVIFNIGVFVFNYDTNVINKGIDNITPNFLFYDGVIGDKTPHISLDKSIPFFYDINSIFFFFKRREPTLPKTPPLLWKTGNVLKNIHFTPFRKTQKNSLSTQNKREGRGSVGEAHHTMGGP